MLKVFTRTARNINKIAADYFAPYTVLDDYGTFQPCWTLKRADAWLPFCSGSAVITARYYGSEIIAARRIVKESPIARRTDQITITITA